MAATGITGILPQLYALVFALSIGKCQRTDFALSEEQTLSDYL